MKHFLRFSIVCICVIFLNIAACMAGERVQNPAVLSGLSLTVQGTNILVASGKCRVDGHRVRVSHAVTLAVAPAPIITVTDEPVKLSAKAPDGFWQGTRLQGPTAYDINAFHSYVLNSLRITRTVGGEALIEGKDYLISPEYAMVGLGPQSSVTVNDTVYASYQYGMLRIDAIEVNRQGNVKLVTGTPQITTPQPPPARKGWIRLANVFRPYRATTVAQDDIYPIMETAAQAKTATTAGRIPKTLAKIRAGQPVTIVCWGDSVTAGGNASTPATRYVDVFAAGLKEHFPKAKINVINVSVGGSASSQWLYPEQFSPSTPGYAEMDFNRIVNAHPDLVTVEFVNDAWMDHDSTVRNYTEMLKRFSAMNAECIFITPHYTHPDWMKFSNMRDAESREYVKTLKNFAEAQKISLADAGARWAHLWKEGIPYLTLLHNTVNHPDDRGHQLFAEELWKCFQ